MSTKLNKLLAASVLASAFAIAPVYAQNSGGDAGGGSDNGGQVGGEDAGGDQGGAGGGSDNGGTAGGGADTGGSPSDGADPSASSTGSAESESGALSAPSVEQQTEMRTIFTDEAAEPATMDSEVTMGMTVPDTVTLQPVPDTIVAVVPEYESYEYFALDDGRTAIVDPDTSTVVYILE